VITLVEALNYRIFADIEQPLDRFQVLIGPNASGKSSFLDIVAFLGDLLRTDLDEAVGSRARELRDVIHMRQDSRFELAVEVQIPERVRRLLPDGGPSVASARYEIAIGYQPNGECGILSETLFLKPTQTEGNAVGAKPEQRELFPQPKPPRSTLMRGRGRTPHGWRRVVVRREESGISYFISERTGWNAPFRLGPRRATLANVPEDQDRFPVAIWVRDFLQKGIQHLQFDIRAMREPSRPGLPKQLTADGATLPWVVLELQRRYPDQFQAWREHVQTALPDLEDIHVTERPEDRSAYLLLRYKSGLTVPSWSASDGTLRLLALTLVAYLPDQEYVYLIEEPENGIHPKAIECVFQSLSSMTEGQLLLATHSPVILNLAAPERILCFAKTEAGVGDVVRGSDHPRLRHWKGEVSLDTLYVAGVLG